MAMTISGETGRQDVGSRVSGANLGAQNWAAADFDSFMVAVAPGLLRLGRSMGARVVTAEDVAAEALARAYASWPRVRMMANPEGWVMRVAANLVCDRARRARWERSAGLDVGNGPPTVGFENVVASRAELLSALRSLPRRQRDAVVLRHIGGLSISDIAAVQRVSSAAVRKRVERALAALRGLLPPAGDVDRGGTEEGKED